jgi:2,3-dimethylmalate lyase
VQARADADFLIVARTDARYSEGLDEALRRAEAFLEAGADILFVESPESPEELRRIGETLRGAALLANMVEGGRTPFLSAGELQDLGYKVALFPGTGFLTAAKALRDGYLYLQSNGTSTGGPAQIPFSEMNTMMGFPAVHSFEAKWGGKVIA